jgi:hypothetical protein
MPSILTVDKLGRIKELKIKDFKVDDLYKKAGFKTPNGFELRHVFPKISLSTNKPSFHIAVYGKISGKAGQENKYEFPPPLDKTLFFGTCLIVNHEEEEEDEIEDIRVSDWNAIYDGLMGGFADLDEEDEEEEEDENDNYVFDDFVVADEEEEEEEEPKPKLKIRKIKVPKKSKKEVVVEDSKEPDAIDYLSELEEESYL